MCDAPSTCAAVSCYVCRYNFAGRCVAACVRASADRQGIRHRAPAAARSPVGDRPGGPAVAVQRRDGDASCFLVWGLAGVCKRRRQISRRVTSRSTASLCDAEGSGSRPALLFSGHTIFYAMPDSPRRRLGFFALRDASFSFARFRHCADIPYETITARAAAPSVNFPAI
jgi:hypothetical protein